MTRGVLLVGHGSHMDANSSTPIHDHARRLRCSGHYAEVRTGFWKEEPSLSRALDAFDADDVTVVPVFISNGYFTQEVIPAEMSLAGRLTRVGGRTIRYTPPIGDHPALAGVIAERAREVARGGEAIAVLGHGTLRNRQSEENVHAQAERVRSSGAFPEVVTVFLDQEPHVRNVLDLVRADAVIVVPLFVADGWHAGQQVPGDLAVAAGEHRRGPRMLYYTGAVGTHPRVADVIHALVAEAAAW